MKVVFYGAKKAGSCCLQGLLDSHDVVGVFLDKENDSEIVSPCTTFELPLFYFDDMNSEKVLKKLEELKPDVLVCCHGRKVLSKKVLDIPKFGGVNLHPCLWKYKGVSPVRRLLEDGGRIASVGAHKMTEAVDGGTVLCEEFVGLDFEKTEEDVYRTLYPFYARVARRALHSLEGKK